ncbi:hypothetical protein RHMOL_Rhmol07G0063500 [Rhododendron molle]|uniref:Uncharacterized protein n=1 Tax=Rhododendron molle TaxID=49168 RepID=A0ACC0MZ29_RHOML|nr:hypothetical protein RHMOL_Rhmol07G0063500 [Rhododendron molle]
MALQGYHFWGLLILLMINLWGHDSVATKVSSSYNRTSFPADFVFGTASSAYQFEGAWKEGGKGQSIYDVFTHKYPDKIANRSNGDVAVDFYHHHKEDVQLMKFMGMDAFRFSISWARILPRGKLSGGVNKEGVAFYNNLINELIANGLKPFITLFHWDLPQALEDEYGGFLSPRIVADFVDFAELCYKEFGDRVKHWITLNEPWTFAFLGYDLGSLAPGRCSAWRNNDCPAGDSATEPYIVGHHMLLCHGAAAKVYKEKYLASQKGQIGISLASQWILPYSNSKLNEEAAQRALDFTYGWFIDPLTYGEYPKIMRSVVGKRLPKFPPEQVTLVKGSCDFVGLNYYTGFYAIDVPVANTVNVSYEYDILATLTSERYGKLIGNPTGVSTNYIFPKGLQDLLIYTKEKYNNPVIYITENGMGDANNVTTKEGVKDYLRIYFYRRHLEAVQNAIKASVNVKGFFAWAFIDNFEWASGYTIRYGLGYVDYHDGLKRYPKRSAFWFKKFNLK